MMSRMSRDEVVWRTLMLEAEWLAAGGTFKRARLTNLVIGQPDLEGDRHR